MAACVTERAARAFATPALLALLAWPSHAGVTAEWRGEASASGLLGERGRVPPELRLRYVPEALATWAARRGLSLDADAAGELRAESRWPRDAAAESETSAELYRLWVGIAGPSTELRAGLQRLDFGSASLLRPLMWFDTLDPRDPLGASEGVWALRGRQTLVAGANLWAWGLLGNGERRGWDRWPARDDRPELGGRLQLAVPRGEVAGAYHRRTAALVLSPPGGAPAASLDRAEDRLGFDGRWDIGIGAWVEGSWTRLRDVPLAPDWQRALCAGADYTIRVLDGVTVTVEHMRLDATDGPLRRGPGRDLSAAAVMVRLGVFDSLRGIAFKDWDGGADSQVLELRRTWDHWSVHLLGYRGGDALGGLASDAAVPAGDGARMVLVYQHGTERR